MKDNDKNKPQVDSRFIWRRLWYNARTNALYSIPDPPDFAAQYHAAQERWQLRRDEMAAGIVSLVEYRAGKAHNKP